MNITQESEQMEKKSGNYDETFYWFIDAINEDLGGKAVYFEEKSRTLYILKKIPSNCSYFTDLCKKYKFFIAKSLFE